MLLSLLFFYLSPVSLKMDKDKYKRMEVGRNPNDILVEM
jgi:hypothetical protein